MLRFFPLFFILASCWACGQPDADLPLVEEPEVVNENEIAFLRNRAIGKGINFGNALEAPNEGEWGLTLEEAYIGEVKKAGFNSVRLLIAWSSHTSLTAPYLIDPAFLARVDEVVGWCIDRNLTAIITTHHFNEFYEAPEDNLYRAMFFFYLGTTEHALSRHEPRQADCGTP